MRKPSFDRVFYFAWVLSFLIGLTLLVGVTSIIVHFIYKYW